MTELARPHRPEQTTPDHAAMPGRTARQPAASPGRTDAAGLLALQRSAGNAAVGHLLVQRDGEEGQGTAEAAGGGSARNPIDDAVRDAVRDALGGDRLQQLADDAIEAAVDALRERATAEGPELLSDEVARRLVYDTVQRELQGQIRRWLASDEGRRARRQLADIAGDNPGAVILLAAVAAAVAGAANVTIPEVSPEVEVGGGVGVTAGTGGGPAHDLLRQRLTAGLSYTAERFAASVGGSYQHGADRPGGAEASLRIGSRQGRRLELRTNAQFNPDGNLVANLGGSLNLGVLGVGGTLTHTAEPEEEGGEITPAWSGRVNLRLGGQSGQPTATGTVHIDENGQVRFGLTGAWANAFDVNDLNLRLTVEQPEAGATPSVSAGASYEIPGRGGVPTIRLSFTGGLTPRELGTGTETATVNEIHGMGTLGLRF